MDHGLPVHPYVLTRIWKGYFVWTTVLRILCQARPWPYRLGACAVQATFPSLGSYPGLVYLGNRPKQLYLGVEKSGSFLMLHFCISDLARQNEGTEARRWAVSKRLQEQMGEQMEVNAGVSKTSHVPSTRWSWEGSFCHGVTASVSSSNQYFPHPLNSKIAPTFVSEPFPFLFVY